MAKKLLMPPDANNRSIPVMALAAPHDVDGTSASAQSSAIDGWIVRITSVDNALRVAIGSNPTAVATSILVPALGEIYLPIKPGEKVAVIGGKANICTCGV
jgi:hypothetical protein